VYIRRVLLFDETGTDGPALKSLDEGEATPSSLAVP